MIPERRDFWLSAFYALAQVWPQLDPTTSRIRVFDEALSDLSVRELDYAVRWVISNHSNTYSPTPGLFRDVIQGPITKVAVTRVDGKVIRWENRRCRSEEYLVAPPGRLPAIPLELQSGNGALTPAERH